MKEIISAFKAIKPYKKIAVLAMIIAIFVIPVLIAAWVKGKIDGTEISVQVLLVMITWSWFSIVLTRHLQPFIVRMMTETD